MVNNLSVSDLNGYIKGVFDDEIVLHNLSVYGEISAFSVSGNNTYITLMEKDCYIQCLRFGRMEKLEIGTQVTVFGSVEFFRKASKVTFIVKNIEETGKGKQFAQFQLLKEQLEKEGLFVNKCVLPTFVKKVAIVTSNTGAVIHDFLSVIRKNHSYIDVNVIQTKVQGEGADISISNAIKQADESCCDVVVIARGGGSANDLDAFNSEIVVRVIGGCKTPTISAVGHQTDYTLCDLAATIRVGTPSIAGETISRINEIVLDRFYTAIDNIKNAAANKFEKLTSSVYYLATKIVHSSEKAIKKQEYKIDSILTSIKGKCELLLSESYRNIKSLCEKQNLVIEKKYLACDKSLALSVSKLENNSPLKILSQGYSVVEKQGKTVRKLKDLEVDDKVTMYFADGQAVAQIKEKKNEI